MVSINWFGNHESGTVNSYYWRHMKNLKIKKCLFTLTMSILTEYSRQDHSMTDLNDWKKKMLEDDIQSSFFNAHLLHKTQTTEKLKRPKYAT